MCFVTTWLYKTLLSLCTQTFQRASWVLTVCSTRRAHLGLHVESSVRSETFQRLERKDGYESTLKHPLVIDQAILLFGT
jgi:hypothetical protein